MRAFAWLRALLTGLLALLVIGPFYWILASSFKSAPEVIRVPPTFFPTSFTLEHYQALFASTDYPRYLLNSLSVAVATIAISLPLSLLAAYAIYRIKFPGRAWFFRLLIGAYIFPGILLIIPIYNLAGNVGLINNLLALVIVNVTFTAPFCVWLLRAFLEGIPVEIEEAAALDGASIWQALTRLIIPLGAPGLATAAIYTFITSWTEFPFASALILDDANRTLPVGLAAIIGQYQIDWGLLAAGAVVMALPVVLLFAFVGRYFVESLSAGALKG